LDITRRNLLLSAAAPALLRSGQPGAQNIELRPRAFVVGGKPVFLVCGSIDYFRCPHELWRDTLLRAKRGGLNAISFCIAWNFHEMREGVFDSTGDRDLGRFVDLCGELSLYAFPRFGPFICDEWEAGGYPAWLMTKPSIELRTMNETALPYVRRWMEKLMPVIVPRQATRGGPVLLIQQENEYYFVGRPGVREYQDFLIRSMRELGIEVPITDCNGANPMTRRPGSLLTLNGGGAGSVKTLRKTQPGKPALITELYTDYMNVWGWPVSSYPTVEMMRQQTAETLAAGGMYAYFMMYGGTNFGFWASTTWKSDQSFVTTRYYARAPIHEGGAFNETYNAAKAVNLLALNFQDLLTAGEDADLPVAFSGPVRAGAVRTPRGYLLFVHPQFPSRVASEYHTDGQSGPLIQLSENWPLPEIASQPGAIELRGEVLNLAEASSYSSMLPFELEIDPGARIDYANATLLGRAGTERRRVLLFRGQAGTRGVVSVNGKRAEFVFTEAEPARIEIGNLTVLGVSQEAAGRTWFAGGRVLIGPAYVGEERSGRHDCFLDGQTSSIVTVSRDGVLDSQAVKPAASVEAQIAFKNWTPHPLPETEGSGSGWRELDRPRTVEEFEAYQGYTWYRAAFHSPQRTSTGLLFTQASDRIHVFVNGRRAGVWGRGPGAVRDPLPVQLEAGENRFVLLCDNMGRLSEGAVLDRKGIGGPAFLDAEVRDLPGPAWSVPERPPTESWGYQTFRHYNPDAKLRRTTYEFVPRQGEGLQLFLRWFPQYAWIALNGRVVAEHAGDLSLAGGVDFSSVVLDPYLSPGPQRLEITVFGAAPSQFESHVRLLAYRKSSELRQWAFRPWTDPVVKGNAPSGHPLWWEAEFAKPSVPGPFFLVTEGLSKGQAYLNGHALGRYWEIGPQHSLYVPDPWFAGTNRFVIFDEEGKSPNSAYLSRDSRVSVHSIVA